MLIRPHAGRAAGGICYEGGSDGHGHGGSPEWRWLAPDNVKAELLDAHMQPWARPFNNSGDNRLREM